MKQLTSQILALWSDSRGVTAVTAAVSASMLLSLAVLTIDAGQALVAKNELHNVADAAALAGARELGVLYAGGPNGTPPPLPMAQQQNFVLSDPTPITTAVENVATANYARGVSITIDPGDIRIGDWDSVAKTFTQTPATPDAVSVTARRDGSANGPITTFLAGMIGINTVSVTSLATAALTGTGSTLPGQLDVPFGISSQWFTNFGCNQPIRFYPTNSPVGCAGWHTFLDSPPNANTLKNIINGLIPTPPTYTTPGTQAGSTELNFIGGNVASDLKFLQNLFDAKKGTDGDGNPNTWTVLVPVYQSSDCSNPNSPMMIVGYATTTITQVLAPPAGQLVDAIVQCGLVDGGRGGGASFGTLGSIPGLVQ